MKKLLAFGIASLSMTALAFDNSSTNEEIRAEIMAAQGIVDSVANPAACEIYYYRAELLGYSEKSATEILHGGFPKSYLAGIAERDECLELIDDDSLIGFKRSFYQLNAEDDLPYGNIETTLKAATQTLAQRQANQVALYIQQLNTQSTIRNAETVVDSRERILHRLKVHMTSEYTREYGEPLSPLVASYQRYEDPAQVLDFDQELIETQHISDHIGHWSGYEPSVNYLGGYTAGPYDSVRTGVWTPYSSTGNDSFIAKGTGPINIFRSDQYRTPRSGIAHGITVDGFIQRWGDDSQYTIRVRSNYSFYQVLGARVRMDEPEGQAVSNIIDQRSSRGILVQAGGTLFNPTNPAHDLLGSLPELLVISSAGNLDWNPDGSIQNSCGNQRDGGCYAVARGMINDSEKRSRLIIAAPIVNDRAQTALNYSDPANPWTQEVIYVRSSDDPTDPDYVSSTSTAAGALGGIIASIAYETGLYGAALKQEVLSHCVQETISVPIRLSDDLRTVITEERVVNVLYPQ